MAVSTVTLSLYDYPKGIDNTQRFQILRGTAAFSTGSYPIDGYTVDWASLKNGGGGSVEAIPVGSASTIIPVEVDMYDVSNPPTGFIFVVDNVGGIHVFICANDTSGASGPLIEGVGDTAFVTGTLQHATIQFTAYFVRE